MKDSVTVLFLLEPLLICCLLGTKLPVWNEYDDAIYILKGLNMFLVQRIENNVHDKLKILC